MPNYKTFATAAPQIVLDLVAELESKFDGGVFPTVELADGTDPGQPDLVYPAGTYTDHTNDLVADVVFTVMQMVPRPSKKEAGFALRIQHPELVAKAARRGAKRAEAKLNDGRFTPRIKDVAPVPAAPAAEVPAEEPVVTEAAPAPRRRRAKKSAA